MTPNFITTKYEELVEEISLFNEMGISAGQKLSGKLNSIRNALQDIKIKIRSDPFHTQPEEIEFFKKWKPLFMGRYYYEQEQFKLDTQKPVSDNIELKNYYIRELSYIEQFTQKHQFFYQYFITDSTELDHFYFLRDAAPPNLIWTSPVDYDRDFGTPGETLFARFICNNWLKEHILNSLLQLDNGNSSSTGNLNWTGEKQNLIEIAYGFWLTKQINNGNATLQQIVKWLENSLHTELGTVQKAFANIRARKRLSPTKYIDQLKEEILKKIEDDFQ